MPQARQNRSRQNMEVRQRETRQEQNARATSAVRTQPLSPERTPEPHRRQNRKVLEFCVLHQVLFFTGSG
jgi:hypothetical protein